MFGRQQAKKAMNRQYQNGMTSRWLVNNYGDCLIFHVFSD